MSQVLVQGNVVAGLQRAGLSQNEARIVAQLFERQSVTTEELVELGMSQPLVCIATKRLREKGWLEAAPIQREGRGRPRYAYALTESGVARIRTDLESALADLQAALGVVS